MRTTMHMPWYGQLSSERFEMRVPGAMIVDMGRLLAYYKAKGRKIRSSAGLIQNLVSHHLAKEMYQVEQFEKAQKKLAKMTTAKMRSAITK